MFSKNLIAVFSIIFLVQALAVRADKWTIIRVRNKALYTARFSVTFNYMGSRMEFKSDEFGYGLSRSLEIPPFSELITVKIENHIKRLEKWKPIMISRMEKQATKCFNIAGNIVKSTWEEVGC